MMSQLDRVKSKQGQQRLAFFTVNMNTEKENRRLT